MSELPFYGLDLQNIQLTIDDYAVGFIVFGVYDPLSNEIYYERQFPVDTRQERLAAFQVGLAGINSFLSSHYVPADAQAGFYTSA